MERYYQQHLEKWIRKNNRKPLIIRGARQVGKSTLVRQFAASQKKKLFEVNIERHPQLASVAQSLNPQKILREIEFICNQGQVDEENSLLFLDEIQGLPQMIQCLRYFYEDMPQLPVIAAGSLLEFTLAEHTFPMPVGRIEYFHMGPVSWEEFLEAKKEKQLLRLLQTFEPGDEIPHSAHERLVGYLRDYLLTGGMPEAVQLYLDGEAWDTVFDVQSAIIQTYRDDFSKYATGRDLIRLQHIIDYLGQGIAKKVKYVNIDRDSQSREIKSALDLIVKAGVVLRAQHSHADGIPLNAQIDPKVFKLYCLDIGFYNRLCDLKYISDSQIHSRAFINEGVIAEQFIAQQLYFDKTPQNSPSLHYWLREGKSKNAEVDFLIQVEQSVVPIEVKAGKSGSLKSLFQFSVEKNIQLACRFDMNHPTLQWIEAKINNSPVRLQLLSLPLYFCNQVQRLTSKLL